MTCESRSRTLLRKTNIRRTRSTPRTHDAFTRVFTASHLRSPPHLHPHVRRVSFEVRHHSSRSRPPVVVAFPARADVVFFFHDASSSRVDVVVTKRRHRACDEEFCACTHADVRARHLVIAELSLPPRRSIFSIVAFSGATSLATRLIFLVEIPRERAPIARRFSAGFRPRERADPAPGPEPARHRIAAAFHARAFSGRSGIFPSPSLQPSKTFDRRDTRSNNCTVRKGPEISAGDISLGE
jgi:hypothetical protein